MRTGAKMTFVGGRNATHLWMHVVISLYKMMKLKEFVRQIKQSMRQKCRTKRRRLRRDAAYIQQMTDKKTSGVISNVSQTKSSVNQMTKSMENQFSRT